MSNALYRNKLNFSKRLGKAHATQFPYKSPYVIFFAVTWLFVTSFPVNVKAQNFSSFKQLYKNPPPSRQAVVECVNSLLYRFPETRAQRNDISGEAAVYACQRVATYYESQAVVGCVNSLLYRFPETYTQRSDISGEAAAYACRRTTNDAQSHEIVNCINSLLYRFPETRAQRTDISGEDAAYACASPGKFY
ncbi:MAG: hypothetical protein MUD14_21365 [Hydrococcus sp. Prado102]|nr:hypothetical protein [Hydrococcus sp. Prado102]